MIATAEIKVKSKVKSRKRNVSKKNMDSAKKRKNPIDLFGIFKDKIHYESDAVLMS